MTIKQILINTSIVFALVWTESACAFPYSEHKAVWLNDDSEIARAFKTKKSNVQVEGEGTVVRILADDVDGSRHQRFIVRLASGQTLLIAHNIDLAPRVEGLKEGDSIGFYGEYVWNSQGGTVHWTHHDPEGRHVAGWLKYNGRTYQ
jgi:hypothetical protein